MGRARPSHGAVTRQAHSYTAVENNTPEIIQEKLKTPRVLQGPGNGWRKRYVNMLSGEGERGSESVPDVFLLRATDPERMCVVWQAEGLRNTSEAELRLMFILGPATWLSG